MDYSVITMFPEVIIREALSTYKVLTMHIFWLVIRELCYLSIWNSNFNNIKYPLRVRMFCYTDKYYSLMSMHILSLYVLNISDVRLQYSSVIVNKP